MRHQQAQQDNQQVSVKITRKNMINSGAETKLFFLLYLVSSLVFTTFFYGATLTNIAASESKTLG